MAFRYTQEVMVILIRQFQSPDEEMKKIVLKVRNIWKTFFFVYLFVDGLSIYRSFIFDLNFT